MTVKEIEEQMANVIVDWPLYQKYKKEHERLLEVMGNVDGDETIVLPIVALLNIGVNL
jgi:hypothetical protein